MLDVLAIDRTWSEPLGWTLVHSTWQVAVIALLLKLTLLAIPARRATWRYGAACGALLVAVVAPIATLMAIGVEPTASRSSATPADAAPMTSPPTAVVEPFGRPSATPALTSTPTRTSEAAPPQPTWRDRLQPWLPTLVIFWLIGVALSAARTLLGEWRARRLCRIDCGPVPDAIEAIARRLAGRLGMTRPVRLLQSGIARVPMAIGCLRPVVLLPISALSGLSTRELETILLHELAHIRRYDALVSLAQSVVEAALFYHPAAWWISGAIRVEREHCCDDLVLRHTVGRATYIRALAQLEEARAPAPALSARGGSLVTRVRRMVGHDLVVHRTREASLAGSFLVTLAVVATFAILPPEARSLPTEPTLVLATLEDERAANEEAYLSSRDYLHEVHKGRWVAIVDGVVIASFETLDEAIEAADQRDAEAAHRFLFRPGVDDGDTEFVQSPWMNSSPNWFQLGRRFRKPFPLTIAPHVWIRDGRKHETPDGKGRIVLGAPGEEPTYSTHTVCSNMFQQDLTMTGHAADELRLDRFAVPGTAWYPSMDHTACRKVLCRVTLGDLDIDATVVAFVFPREYVDRVAPSADLEFDLDALPWNAGKKGEDADAQLDTDPPTEDDGDSWVVRGRVIDAEGRPVSGATIRVFTGIGTLRNTGESTSDEDGRYECEFGPGVRSPSPDTGESDVPLQAASIFVSRDGFVEKDLGRAGNRMMAARPPKASSTTPWGDPFPPGEEVILRGQPATIDFVLVPAATVEGIVVDKEGRRLARRAISITGENLPPSSSVLQSMPLSLSGEFRFEAVPTNQPWRFEIRVGPWSHEVRTENRRFPDAKVHKVLIVVDTNDFPWSATIQPLSADAAELPASYRRELSTVTHNYGEPATDDPSVAWGKESRGLQAGLRLPKGDSYTAGDRVDVELVIRNVGDETITFESSTWRQEDDVTIREVGGKVVNVSRSWYSGLPEIHRYTLEPRTQVILSSGPIGIQRADGASLGHPVVYQAPMSAGRHAVLFRLHLPDINRFAAEEGHYKGALTTGEVEFTVK